MAETLTTGTPGSIWERARRSCFYSPAASVVSVALGALIVLIVWTVLRWAVWDGRHRGLPQGLGRLLGVRRRKVAPHHLRALPL